MPVQLETIVPIDLDLEQIQSLNSLSERLNQSYAELEQQVSDLTQQLDAVREARSQELIERERLALRLSALIDSLPGGVLVLDQNHVVILANPQAMDLLGADLIEENFLSIIESKAARVSADGKQLHLISGKTVALSNEISDHYGDQIVLLTDVTDVQQQQEESNRARRLSMLGETIARLAHQIRTPLSAALLYLSQAQQPLLEAPRKILAVEKAQQRLRHMEQVINQSLNYVQGESATNQSCSLFELIDALRTSLLPLIEHRRGKLSVDLPPQDLLVRGDQESLLSALVAIAENALEISDPLNIEIVVSLNDAVLDIAIKDFGPGFDEALIDRVFEPFFTTRSEGTGLGLALAATIAHNHDGQVTARNLTRGGAAVTLSLPRARITESLSGGQHNQIETETETETETLSGAAL